MKQAFRTLILAATLTLAAVPVFADGGPAGGDPPPPGTGSGSGTGSVATGSSGTTTSTTTATAITILLGYLGL